MNDVVIWCSNTTTIANKNKTKQLIIKNDEKEEEIKK